MVAMRMDSVQEFYPYCYQIKWGNIFLSTQGLKEKDLGHGARGCAVIFSSCVALET